MHLDVADDCNSYIIKAADFLYRHRLLLVPRYMHMQFTVLTRKKHPDKIRKKRTWIL